MDEKIKALSQDLIFKEKTGITCNCWSSLLAHFHIKFWGKFDQFWFEIDGRSVKMACEGFIEENKWKSNWKKEQNTVLRNWAAFVVQVYPLCFYIIRILVSAQLEVWRYMVNFWQHDTCIHDSLMVKILKTYKGIKGLKNKKYVS